MAATAVSERPRPAGTLLDPLRLPERFEPAPEVWEWARAALVAGGSPLHNPEHFHLQFARVGVLWTNVQAVRQQRQTVGMAEIPAPKGSKWAIERQKCQMREWFGDVPDFVITLDAIYSAQANDATWCALVEHELYHCGQATDQYGVPKFSSLTGLPMYAMRGHDVEEFVGIVRRWGSGAAAGGVAELVEAAKRKPEIAAADIASMCGTCQARR